MNVLDDVALSSPQQKVLRGVVLLAPAAFIVLVPVAGGVFDPFFSIVGLALAVLVALLPDTNAALGLVVYLSVLWAVFVPDTLGVLTLAAAACVLALHVACTLLAYGPPGLTLDPVLLRLWGRRTVLGLVVAGLVWVAARVVRVLDLPPAALGTALSLLVVIAWVSVLALRLRPPPGH